MSVQRKYRRYGFGRDDPTHELRIEDLSRGGMRLRSNRALRIGQRLDVNVPMGEESLTLRARVVRCALSAVEGYRYEYGAKLARLGDPERLRLDQLIATLEASETPIPEDPRLQDLEDLRRRVADLQKEILHLEGWQAAQLARREQKSAEEMNAELEQAFRTSFGLARFAHLVRLGQPLMKTSQSPVDRLVGQRYSLVADALDGAADLKSLAAVLRRELTEEAIVEVLFELYERKRLDFA